MSDITNIRESLTSYQAELQAELDRVNEAVAALIDTHTVEEVVVTDKPVKKQPAKSVDTDDERRANMLANLEKARAARQANLAAKRGGNAKKRGTKKVAAQRATDTADMNMAETIMYYVEQGLDVAEVVEETGAHPSYVYSVRRAMMQAA